MARFIITKLLLLLLLLSALVIIPVQKMTAAPNVGAVVDLVLTPASLTVNPGGTFNVILQVQPNNQDVAGVDVFLTFNPAHLEVVSVAPGSILKVVLNNTFNNTAGTLDYSAGTLEQPFPATSFTLVTFSFKAKSLTANTSTTIAFSRSPPRTTNVTSGSTPVIRNVNGTQIAIQVAAGSPPPPAPAPKPAPAPSPTPSPLPKPAVTPTPSPAPAPAPAPAPSPSPKSPTPTPSPSPDSSSGPFGLSWLVFWGGIIGIIVLIIGILILREKYGRD